MCGVVWIGVYYGGVWCDLWSGVWCGATVRYACVVTFRVSLLFPFSGFPAPSSTWPVSTTVHSSCP